MLSELKNISLNMLRTLLSTLEHAKLEQVQNAQKVTATTYPVNHKSKLRKF